MLKPYHLLTAAIAAFVIGACSSNDLDDDQTGIDCSSVSPISFSATVQPLVTTKCAISGCHNGDNGAERNWTVPENLQDHASEVKRRIQLPEGDPAHMPATGELTDTELRNLVCWVEQGAPIDN